MTQLSHQEVQRLSALVEQGYLTVRLHPTADLLLWNYTPKTQFERYWTPETMMCRGLITRSDGTIVAKPFCKFFNWEEYEGPLPLEAFTVTEKMDGSLGIVYFLEGTPYIATRGSFTSEQARRGTAILHRKYAHFPFQPQYTYLFEIIYPGNRIVVDYGDMEDVILLAVIETATGRELDISPTEYPFPVVKRYDGIKDLAQLKALEAENQEGFVIRFESGLRLKLKFATYKRLHRLLTQCTSRTIWELLRTEQSFDDLLQRVPDEFYTWVQQTRDELLAQFCAIETQSRTVVERVRDLPTRKEQAAIILQERSRAIMFLMLDGRDYKEAIWKLLYPPAERPFRIDEESV